MEEPLCKQHTSIVGEEGCYQVATPTAHAYDCLLGGEK